MFKKYHNTIISLLFGGILLVSCQKPDDYKKYTNEGEKIYPGAAAGARSFPGNARVLLSWIHGIDNRVKKYKVTWNNGTASKEMAVGASQSGDTLKLYIDQLAESSYNFIIYSLDDAGNQSVSKILPPVRAYGPQYQAGLLNRAVINTLYSGATKTLTVTWGVPDTINLATEIWYTDTLGTAQKLRLSGDNNTSVFDWQAGSKIYYKSIYKPGSSAIDSFEVSHLDSITVGVTGTYRAVGVRKNYNADGSFASNTGIDLDKELNRTPAAGVYESDDIANLYNRSNSKLILTMNPDNTIDVSGYLDDPANKVENHPTAGKSYFDPATRQFIMRYKYTNTTSNGSYRLMEETWTKK